MVRGVKVVTGSNAAYDWPHLWVAGFSWPVTSQGWTVSGWMRILGTTHTGWGHCPFTLVDNHDGDPSTNFYFQTDQPDSNSAGPWNLEAYSHSGGWFGTNSSSNWDVNTGTDYFFALTYNPGTTIMTGYIGVDGIASSASLYAFSDSGTEGSETLTTLEIGSAGWNGDGNNCEITNVKVWTSVLTQAQLFTEMNSEVPVITTGCVGHYKLANLSDLTNYYGSLGSLTIEDNTWTGTYGITNATLLDPSDIPVATPAMKVYSIL